MKQWVRMHRGANVFVWMYSHQTNILRVGLCVLDMPRVDSLFGTGTFARKNVETHHGLSACRTESKECVCRVVHLIVAIICFTCRG